MICRRTPTKAGRISELLSELYYITLSGLAERQGYFSTIIPSLRDFISKRIIRLKSQIVF
jgi:hypothetical protein